MDRSHLECYLTLWDILLPNTEIHKVLALKYHTGVCIEYFTRD